MSRDVKTKIPAEIRQPVISGNQCPQLVMVLTCSVALALSVPLVLCRKFIRLICTAVKSLIK